MPREPRVSKPPSTPWRRDRTGGLVVCAVVSAALIAVVWPLSTVAWSITTYQEAAATPPAGAFGSLLVTTIAYAAMIGTLAALLGGPAGWWLGRAAHEGTGAGRLAALFGVPLMLPNYLAYAAWNLLRAPMSHLGDWLARASEGSPWISIAAGRALAVAGLSFWAWPLAAIVIAIGAGSIPQSVIDSLRLDARGAWSRAVVLIRLLSPWIFAAVAVVALAMLGTAIPLHLAQIQTFAIHLWKVWDLTHRVEPVWIGAWPLLLVAAGAAILLVRQKQDRPPEGPHDGAGRCGLTLKLLAGVVWSLAVVAPTAFFAWTLRRPSLLLEFWRSNGAAAAGSACTAAVAGLLVAGLALGVWFGLSGTPSVRRSAAMWSAWAFIFTGLIPGALLATAVGGALARAEWSRSIADLTRVGIGPVGAPVAPSVVLVHVARFGIVGALIALSLSRSEPQERRDHRRLDGAEGLAGWWRAVGAANWSTLLGVALATACLSIHEIESTVIVQPPGAGALAQRLLENLHYLREDETAAAAINMVGATLVLALLGGWLLSGAALNRDGGGAGSACPGAGRLP